MSPMLGEMLLKVGALTEEQLEQVLNAQAIYGGRLGTNLVEMGLVSEDDLARVLHDKSGVPCVEIASLSAIPSAVLELIPLDMIQRYRVLPIALNGKKLVLAMADPSDFAAIDEIGFATGLVIVPRVCSELRLAMALERYFGIKRTVRYIPVEGGTRSRFAGAAADWGAGDVAGGAGSGAATGDNPAGGRQPSRVPVKTLVERFSVASNEAEVVSVLLCYLAGEFDRGAFLSVRGGVVAGVRAMASGAGVDGFAALSFPMDESDLVQRVVEERQLFIGELAARGPEGKLLKALGVHGRSPGLLVPLAFEGQVGALICANDRTGRLAGGVFDLQRVAAMAELTFEMLRLRKRIRAG